jgi:hypothetical protein
LLADRTSRGAGDRAWKDEQMKTQSALLLELLTTELGAAARSARDVRTRLKVVQKILMDVPQVVTVDDVPALYAALRAAEAIEQSLGDCVLDWTTTRRAGLDVPAAGTP